MTADVYSSRALLDKLGVKPGSRVAVLGVEDPSFLAQLRERTPGVVLGKPRSLCDLVFLGADRIKDLEMIRQAKRWIEPNGAVWIVRPKGGRGEIRDTDVIAAGLAAGLVDNKVVSFSPTHSAIRCVFRLRDRPR